MFLPRSLHPQRPSSSHPAPRPSLAPPPPPAAARDSAAEDPPSEDPAILCSLAFSDYEIWSNPTLRDPNHNGFVPLRTLVHTSPVFLAANTDSLTEGSIVRSLRTHATNIFDIQMIVLDKMRPRRSRHGHAPAGGYKIRRKDWAEVTRHFPTFSLEHWDIRTIYIENIPLEFRSIIGTSKLLHRLLVKNHRTPSFSLSDYRCVQSILFPPHHQDPPDAVPKCRGFALVTFSTPSDASRLLADFPYHYRENNHSADSDDDDPSAEEREARKAGFRTLSKERWESLQAEYVEYRDALLSRIAASSVPAPASCSAEPAVPMRTAPADNVTDASGKARLQHASEAPMKFPPGCVVFARHVPETTNKTALRALFSALLADSSTTALDYVDYTKGLDTCHLRLSTREHALSLLKRFKLKCGKGDGEEDKIMLESLDGRREEMYWEGVPDKVRALAVQRAQQAQKAQQANGDLVQKDGQDGAPMASGELKPPRKRQRR
ncbi:hypothetical protein BGY98DRAFT_1022351 [Russula aff. rugulosa BPL654]|nr:hypothetical protein BGY98DRAFT_1022351 [Russula aff. rugulosa BPL654]